MAKGEIAQNACFEQFLLLSLYVFKKLSAAEMSESVYMRERVKRLDDILNEDVSRNSNIFLLTFENNFTWTSFRFDINWVRISDEIN